MKQLVVFWAARGGENMENSPLCYIVPNCNIDGRRQAARTNGRKNGAYMKNVFFAVCATPNTATIHTANNFFQVNRKKLEKLY